MLTPTLTSCADMLAQLERERWRAHEARHPSHRADHLYNLCITALALKDHVLHALGATEALRSRCYELWNTVPELVAATEIANTTKHALLRRPPTTQAVAPATATLLVAYVDESVNGGEIEERDIPTFQIVLSDGRNLELFRFGTHIVGYWQAFFDANDIPRRHQDLDELYDLRHEDTTDKSPLPSVD
jgi:hypothetical protein